VTIIPTDPSDAFCCGFFFGGLVVGGAILLGMYWMT